MAYTILECREELMKIIKRYLPPCTLLLVLILLPCWAWGATYYVAQTTAGTGDGTSYVNRASVSYHNASSGVFADLAGDIVYLCDTITSRVDVPSGGTSKSNRVIYSGAYPGHPGKISRTETAEGVYGLFIRGKEYITVQDLEVENCGNGIVFYDSCDYITIRRCTIHDILVRGIYAGSDSDNPRNTNVIIGGAPGDGNEIYDVGCGTAGYDIKLSNSDHSIISYNHCYATKSDRLSTDRGIAGISWHDPSYLLIEYNTVHDHNDNYWNDPTGNDDSALKGRGEGGIGGKNGNNIIIRYNNIYNHTGGHDDQHGIKLWGNWSYCFIYGNQIYNNHYGIYVFDSSTGGGGSYGPCGDGIKPNHVYVYNNIIHSSQNGSGIHVGSYGCTGCDDLADYIEYVYISNNLIAENHNGENFYKAGLSLSDRYRYVYVKNNIFYKNRPTGSDHRQIFVNSTSNVTIDYNQYHWPNQTSQTMWGGTLYNSISVPNQEAYGKEGDPGFSDAANNDYTLAIGSVCKDAGISLDPDYADALDPKGTDWSTIPPTIKTANQEDYDSWDKGPYIYMIFQLVPPQNLTLDR